VLGRNYALVINKRTMIPSPKEITGQALLDEDFLKKEGVTDFSGYACVAGTNPPRIPWFI
jgi:hypothetical protein